MLRSEKTRTTSGNDFKMSPSVEGRRRLESGASVTVTRFVGRSQSLTAGATGELYINRGAPAWPMAKRKYTATKRNKIEPSVQTITLGFDSVSAYFPPGQPTLATYFVDLSQIACLVNRRFYRQGINWAVAGFKLTATSELGGSARVLKLPNTWVMSNAWEKSMRTWNRMNRAALAETESVRPKFLDFKIYANADHHQNGYANNLMPTGANGTVYTAGEWEPSKVVIPNTNGSDNAISSEFVAVGANYPGVSPVTGLNAVSLIEGYAASRGLPDILSPNTPDDAASVNGNEPANWMAATFNQGTDQDDTVLDDMITENNMAPYPFENDGVHLDTMYPGGANQAPTLELHDISQVSSTTIGGTTRLKGGNFPCGLMVLQFTGLTSVPFMQIDLMPGNHRGYLCEPMTEM